MILIGLLPGNPKASPLPGRPLHPPSFPPGPLLLILLLSHELLGQHPAAVEEVPQLPLFVLHHMRPVVDNKQVHSPVEGQVGQQLMAER